MLSYKKIGYVAIAGLMFMFACKPDPIPTEVTEDTYAGGQLGTTFNTSATALVCGMPVRELR